MRKFLLAFAALALCTLPSCISVGMNKETEVRADAAIVEIKRLNDSLEAFRKDLQILSDQLKAIFKK